MKHIVEFVWEVSISFAATAVVGMAIWNFVIA